GRSRSTAAIWNRPGRTIKTNGPATATSNSRSCSRPVSTNTNSRRGTAMKSVNPLALILLMLLGGCASQQQTATPDSLTLQNTARFLPRQQYDEQGRKLPYQASENPYLLQSGRLNKGSVLLFTEARRALAADDEKRSEERRVGKEC